MKIPKRRNCKICKASFKPGDLGDWGCCPDHQRQYITGQMDKARDKQQQYAKNYAESRAKKMRDLPPKKKPALRVVKIKPYKPPKERAAQDAFNSYIRQRDFMKPCISCGKPLDWFATGSALSAVNAGHYRTIGACAALRFNVFNCNAQCFECNTQKSGNVTAYRAAIKDKWGESIANSLEGFKSPRSFSADELERVRKVFTVRAKRLQKKNQSAIFCA